MWFFCRPFFFLCLGGGEVRCRASGGRRGGGCGGGGGGVLGARGGGSGRGGWIGVRGGWARSVKVRAGGAGEVRGEGRG